jgi:hypothetical protein
LLEPPSLDDYFDHVLRHHEEELTSEEVAAEARFQRRVDEARLLHAEDPGAVLEEIVERLRG